MLFISNFTELTCTQGSLPILSLDSSAVHDATGAVTPPLTNETREIKGELVQTVEASSGTYRRIVQRYYDTYTGKLLVPENQVAIDGATATNQDYSSLIYQDYVRWCDFPGEKLCKETEFTVNGNPMDKYDKYSYVFYRQHFLKEDKKRSYYKCIGQEVPHEVHETSNGLHKKQYNMLDGLQTPKLRHESATFLTPLQFWFCKDSAHSFLSAAVPYGQRFVNVDLTPVGEMVGKACRYKKVSYVMTYTGGTVTPSGADFTLADFHTVIPTFEMYVEDAYTTGKVVYPNLNTNNLLVQNIFVPVTIHNIYISKIIYKMIKKHMLVK